MEVSDYVKIAEDERLITRVLASINIQRDEVEAMLHTYRELRIKKIKVHEMLKLSLPKLSKG